jgi:hypothetical protein
MNTLLVFYMHNGLAMKRVNIKKGIKDLGVNLLWSILRRSNYLPVPCQEVSFLRG